MPGKVGGERTLPQGGGASAEVRRPGQQGASGVYPPGQSEVKGSLREVAGLWLSFPFTSKRVLKERRNKMLWKLYVMLLSFEDTSALMCKVQCVKAQYAGH